MKVSTLISKLYSLDPKSEVVWQSHDQSPNEFDGHIRSVDQADEDFFTNNSTYDGSVPVVILGP